MLHRAVNATVREKAHQMNSSSLRGTRLERVDENGVREKIFVIDRFRNASQILIDDPAGSHRHMTDFGISHHSGR